MSKIISELVGKDCLISTDKMHRTPCKVLEIDEEWIKLLCTDKKRAQSIQIVKIDSIEHIELAASKSEQ